MFISGDFPAQSCQQLSLQARENSLPSAVSPNWSIRVIDTPKAFARFAARLSKLSEFSIDTETWGPEGERLDKELCLIQIGIPKTRGGRAVPEEGESILIDVLALQAAAQEARSQNGEFINPLEPLRAPLESETVTKVVQHAQFERGQFEKYGIELNAVVDTEALAKEIRPDLASHSLAALSLELLEKPLSKSDQTSDWHQRPLEQHQINYAALDAEITMEVYSKLLEIRDAVQLPESLEPDELLHRYLETFAAERDLLRAGAGNFLGQLELYSNNIAQQIHDILRAHGKSGERVEFRSENGSAVLEGRAINELDLAQLRKLFPDLAAEVVRETALVEDIEEALRGRGFDTAAIENILEKIYPRVGTTNPYSVVRPSYAQLETYSKDLPDHQLTWGTREITQQRELLSLVSRLRKSGSFTLLAERESGSKKISIAVGEPAQDGETGTVHILKLPQIEASVARRQSQATEDGLCAFQALLELGDITKIVHDSRKTASALNALEWKLAGEVDTRALAKELRPDLKYYSLTTCAHEILEVIPAATDTAAGTVQLTDGLYNHLQRAQLLAQTDESWNIDQLLGELITIAGIRQQTLRNGLGNQLAQLRIEREQIRDRFKEHFLAQEDSKEARRHRASEGSAWLQARAVHELDVEMFRNLLPELAQEARFETAFRKDIEQGLRERGFNTRLIESVISELYQEVGRGEAVPGFWPKYSRLYMEKNGGT